MRAPRFVRGCAQQSLNPLEPAFDVEQLDLLRLFTSDHGAGLKVVGPCSARQEDMHRIAWALPVLEIRSGPVRVRKEPRSIMRCIHGPAESLVRVNSGREVR
jgi:hypothetical protein